MSHYSGLLDAVAKAAEDVSENGYVPMLSPDTRLEELGFDSVQLAELVSAVAEQLGVPANPELLYGAQTVGDLLGALGTRVPA